MLTDKNQASLAYSKPIGLSPGFVVWLDEVPWLVSMETALPIANPRKRLSGLCAEATEKEKRNKVVLNLQRKLLSRDRVNKEHAALISEMCECVLGNQDPMSPMWNERNVLSMKCLVGRDLMTCRPSRW